jgi:actin-related protein 3
VINSCVKHIPLAGRDVTKYILNLLRTRNERIAAEDIMDVARQIKEEFCYVCRDPDKELAAFADGSKNKTF